MQGRGVFVAEIDSVHQKQVRMEQLRKKIKQIREFCEVSAISQKEVMNMIDEVFGGKEDE